MSDTAETTAVEAQAADEGAQVTPFVTGFPVGGGGIVLGTDTTEWRWWVAQQGGMTPSNAPPYMFPGIGPITDYINPNNSTPSYYPLSQSTGLPTVGTSPYVPMQQNMSDPFTGWTAQQAAMRPAIPGMTSP